MMNKIITCCLILLIGSSVISCATIVNDDMVFVPIETNPSPAKITVNGRDYKSPATVGVPRGKGNFVVHIEKEGYEPMDITLRQSLDGWLLGNILFGGLIGLAIDFISGDAYDLDPAVVRANMIRQ